MQLRRKSSAALQGKHGFATLRDLFRWAERYRQSGKQETRFYDWDQHLADEGYLVLAGKVRKHSEAQLIIEVLEKFLKRRVDPHNLFSCKLYYQLFIPFLFTFIFTSASPLYKQFLTIFVVRLVFLNYVLWHF